MLTTSPSLVSHGIRVSVRSVFLPDQSNAEDEHFCFAYRIHIVNESEVPVQLLRRYWDITDANGQHKFVMGDGVIGKQPTLQPGEHHTYVSGSVLPTTIGRMSGSYTFTSVNGAEGNRFQVEIPSFLLVASHQMN